MITSWPSGPSPQISTSGSKSGLSLYANAASCNPLHHPHRPANHGPPCWRARRPIAALRLTMPSKINIKPSAGDKRGQISEGTGETEGLRRILSAYAALPHLHPSPPSYLYTAQRSLAARPPPIIFQPNVLIGQLWLRHAVTWRRRWKVVVEERVGENDERSERERQDGTECGGGKERDN